MTIPIVAATIRGLWLITKWLHSLDHKTESAERDKFSRAIWVIAFIEHV